jgi:hypothetical protein
MATKRAFEPFSNVTFDLKHAVFVENMTAQQFTPHRRDDDVILILANGTHLEIGDLTDVAGMTACIALFNEIFHTMMAHVQVFDIVFLHFLKKRNNNRDWFTWFDGCFM